MTVQTDITAKRLILLGVSTTILLFISLPVTAQRKAPLRPDETPQAPRSESADWRQDSSF